MKDLRFSRGSGNLTKRRMKGAELFWLFLFAFLLGLPMLWIASVRNELLDYGYKIQELQTTNARLMEEQEQLVAEMAHLRRPDRIFSELQKRGFVPTKQKFVVYEGEEVLVAELPRSR